MKQENVKLSFISFQASPKRSLNSTYGQILRYRSYLQ